MGTVVLPVAEPLAWNCTLAASAATVAPGACSSTIESVVGTQGLAQPFFDSCLHPEAAGLHSSSAWLSNQHWWPLVGA